MENETKKVKWYQIAKIAGKVVKWAVDKGIFRGWFGATVKKIK